MLEDALQSLGEELAVSEASLLCAPSERKRTDLLRLLKHLFDGAVHSTSKKFGPLETLVVSKLDSDSIWEEIQSRNRPLIRYAKNSATYFQKFIASEEEEDLEEEGVEEYSEEEEEPVDGTDGSDEGEGEEDFDFEEGRDDFEEDEEDEGDEDDAPALHGGDDVDDLEALLDSVEESEELYVNRLMRVGGKAGHRGSVEDVSACSLPLA